MDVGICTYNGQPMYIVAPIFPMRGADYRYSVLYVLNQPYEGMFCVYIKKNERSLRDSDDKEKEEKTTRCFFLVSDLCRDSQGT